jgi:DNA polymerase-3 subunit beta
MKFSVSSRELLRILKATGAVILRKNSLPILADHLFTRDGDKFFITGSSQENSLTMPIGITLDNGSDFQPFCLLAVDIIPLLGALPEQPITVEVDMSNHIAKIIYQSGQVSVPVEDSAEYPRVSDVKDPKTSFDIEANIFFPAVKAANGCTAIDSTLRPQMSAVALDVQDEGVVFVGSDGHSLYKYSYQHGAPFLTGSKVVILIPNTIAGQLQAPFAGVETLTIQHDGKHVCLKAGDITFTIRDIEQKYPNYNSVIPKNSPYHATLPVAALAGAVKRVQLMASDASNMVKLSKEGMFLNLSAEDYDFSKTASENLVLAEVDNPLTIPDGFAIGFKASSLLMLLGNISTDNVTLQLSEPSRAILVLEDAPNSALVELLMPMQLNA